jgi:hypothetical protein
MAIPFNATPVGTSEVKAQRHFSIALCNRLAVQFNSSSKPIKDKATQSKSARRVFESFSKTNLSLRNKQR